MLSFYFMYGHGKLKPKFLLMQCLNRAEKYFYLRESKAPRLTKKYTHRRLKMPRKIVNHEFWRKVFCLVVITFTSLKVSLAGSRHLLEEKKIWGPGGFKMHIKAT